MAFAANKNPGAHREITAAYCPYCPKPNLRKHQLYANVPTHKIRTPPSRLLEMMSMPTTEFQFGTRSASSQFEHDTSSCRGAVTPLRTEFVNVETIERKIYSIFQRFTLE